MQFCRNLSWSANGVINLKYRKKPVVIEAVQWDGYNIEEIQSLESDRELHYFEGGELIICTLEGNHHASVGDYIIKGVHGELYPCKPDIFAETYEAAESSEPSDELVRMKDVEEILRGELYPREAEYLVKQLRLLDQK